MTIRRDSFIVALLLTLSATAPAHRLDECLQATRVSVFPNHLTIQTYVTPGTLLAAGLFFRIDTDKDGTISTSEGREYAEKFLRGIALRIDDVPAPLTLTGSQYPSIDELSAGEAMIRVDMSAATSGARGRHRVVLQNDNDPATSIYLANAMLPKDPSILIISQARDETQRTLTLEYDLKSVVNTSADIFEIWISPIAGIVSGLGLALIARHYLRRGPRQGPTQKSASWGDASAMPSTSSGEAK